MNDDMNKEINPIPSWKQNINDHEYSIQLPKETRGTLQNNE